MRASACERLDAALARIDDPKGEGARACLTVYREAAQAAAEAADARAKSGISLGPLDGAIVSIKDLFDVAGEVTRAGSKLLAEEGQPAESDAPVVRRLRGAGAVIVAKTNMTEFAYSGVGANPHFGTPGNPADRARVPGGSSAGGAVAVADRMCEIAIGSDTGGSTRIPAALCGIVGFKPSRQRVPTDGVFPLSFTLDSIGPMAGSVAECAAADAVMAGEAPHALEPAPLANLRIGVAQGMPLDRLDNSVGKRFPAALDRLEKAGTRLSEEKLPLLDRMAQVNAKGGVLPAEAYALHRDRLARRGNAIDPNVRVRLERAAKIVAADYIDMTRARAELVRAMDCSACRSRCACDANHPDRGAAHRRSGGARRVCPQERALAAQYLDVEFLRLLRHFAAAAAAAAARQRSAGRSDAGRAQRPRPSAVADRRGGGAAVRGLVNFRSSPRKRGRE